MSPDVSRHSTIYTEPQRFTSFIEIIFKHDDVFFSQTQRQSNVQGECCNFLKKNKCGMQEKDTMKQSSYGGVFGFFVLFCFVF